MPPPARILLAEDNLADVNLIVEVLRDNGLAHILDVVSDGEEALHLAGNAGNGGAPCPDLLVLDLHLPKVDGPEILRRFRANANCIDTPVIVLSGSQLSPAANRLVQEFKGVSFVVKPATLADATRFGHLIRGMLEGL